ncbi:hypothetical protein Pcinc_039316 [Petrolisthes cinctipes]|uniref:Uncharacterized protein n=1 Tax=Petrolisthes cinctipes TaxID=88211 RepID=A0AAE1BSM0_PETCI|nr:hypothetical protein Pcinc_039316 [Petrolisthes cinctipes]
MRSGRRGRWKTSKIGMGGSMGWSRMGRDGSDGGRVAQVVAAREREGVRRHTHPGRHLAVWGSGRHLCHVPLSKPPPHVSPALRVPQAPPMVSKHPSRTPPPPQVVSGHPHLSHTLPSCLATPTPPPSPSPRLPHTPIGALSLLDTWGHHQRMLDIT